MTDCKNRNRNNCYHILSVNGKKHKCHTWENNQSQYNNCIYHTDIIAYPTGKIQQAANQRNYNQR